MYGCPAHPAKNSMLHKHSEKYRERGLLGSASIHNSLTLFTPTSGSFTVLIR